MTCGGCEANTQRLEALSASSEGRLSVADKQVPKGRSGQGGVHTASLTRVDRVTFPRDYAYFQRNPDGDSKGPAYLYCRGM